MTSLQNEDIGRKSSVYNQTGQSYFEQLSAYNRMSSHLRRTLLARSVVDSRNKKYMRDKRLSSRSSSCSKSLDQILARSDILDEVVYDTESHPIDLLRMSLGCDPECRQFNNNKKRIPQKINPNCNNVQCPSASPKTARRRADGSAEIARRSRTINGGSIVKSNNRRSSCVSARSCGFTGSRRSDRRSDVNCERRIINEKCQTRHCLQSNRVSVDTSESYNYDSSFESSSDTSEIDSPVGKKIECSTPRSSRARSIDRAGIELGRQLKKLSNNVENIEESKYAKFLYDITQEIMLNGLYTDKELQEIFKKHVEMNSDSLDRDKMLSEIYHLKISLNVEEFSNDEDEENDIERFLGSGKFASFSPKKPPTPPKILDENKLEERLKNHEESCRFEESGRRTKNSRDGKNTVVLVDANPEMLITECDLLVTLMELKLDPRQIRTICKSLQNKSRETALTQTVQVNGEESSYSRRRLDCGNSPILAIKTEREKTNETFRSVKLSRIRSPRTRRDETTGTSDRRDRSCSPNCGEDPKRSRNCACQCGEEKKTCSRACGISTKETRVTKLPIKLRQSQANDEKPEIGVQTPLVSSQTRGITTSSSLERINGLTTRSRSRSSETRRTPAISRTDWREKNGSPDEKIRTESSKNRKTSSSRMSNNEQIKLMENIKNERTKRNKGSSIVEVSSAKNGQTDESDTLPILKLKREIVETSDRIDEIPKTSGINDTELRRSVDSTDRKFTINDENDTDSMVVKKSPDTDRSPEKLRNESRRIDVDISEVSEATITDIATEQDSPVPPDDEKNYEISDDETTSLPEDISQVEESQNIEEPSMMDLETDEKSRDTITSGEFEKSKFIGVKNSDPTKLHIVDESEEEDISTTNTNTNQDSPGRSKINNSDDVDRMAVLRRITENSRYNEIANVDGKELTDSSQRDEDDPSISEELEHRRTNDDAESNGDEDQTKIRSIDLKKKKHMVDEKADKQTRVTRQPIERSRRKQSTMNDIHGGNVSSVRRSRNYRPIEVISPASEKARGYSQESSNGRKKRELICSPCFGKFYGRSKYRDDSAMSLEIPRRSSVIRENEREITTLGEEAMTTASDISLLNKEYSDDTSIQASYVNASRANEIGENSNFKIESVAQISNTPLHGKNNVSLGQEEQPSLELRDSRRDTIHRRTSLIRSLRIAMENLKKRRNTNDIVVTTDFHEIIAEPSPSTTSDTTLLPESQENISVTEVESLDLKNSFENTTSPETKESPRPSHSATINDEKISKISSIDASTWTTVEDVRFNDEDPSVKSTMNRCRPDCRGFRRSLDQLKLHNSSPSYSTKQARRLSFLRDNDD